MTQPAGSKDVNDALIYRYLIHRMGLCGSKRDETNPKTRRFQKIPDRFNTIEEVQKALRHGGLEACQLIVGIDFTKSNTWTGKLSFNGNLLSVFSSTILMPPSPQDKTCTLFMDRPIHTSQLSP